MGNPPDDQPDKMGYATGKKYNNGTNYCLNNVAHKANTMWEAIAYVSSGLTLAAFLAAVVAWVYKHQSEEKERLLRAAPQSQRAKLVEQALESFHVDTSSLTKAQQYNLAVQQIQARAQRFRWTAIVVVILVLIAATVAVYAIDRIAAPRLELSQEQTKPLVQTLSGSIHNETNDPLPNVQVALPEFGITTRTNALGRFSLQAEAPYQATVELLAQKEGYQTHRQYATLGNTQLSFTLQPKKQ